MKNVMGQAELSRLEHMVIYDRHVSSCGEGAESVLADASCIK